MADLTRILDSLEHIEASVPGLGSRVDRARIAAAGPASTLLGARVLDTDGKPGEDMSDPRVKAGVLLSVTGTGDSLAPSAAHLLTLFGGEHAPGGTAG